METNVQSEPLLIEYGIQNEKSDIRAHVAVADKKLFVFPTRCALEVMQGYPRKPAFQPGVEGITGWGHVVPPAAISNMRRLTICESRLIGFTNFLSTADKGERAVQIVRAFLAAGRLPLWTNGEVVTDQEMQIEGTDILVKGQWHIQVKCDYWASDVADGPEKLWPRRTGNLYLQTHERNPLHFF